MPALKKMAGPALDPAPAAVRPARAPLSLPSEELLSWLAVEKGRSHNTLAAYRRDLVAYESWLRSQGLDPGTMEDGSVDEGTVARYVANLRTAGLAPASVARAMVAIRSLHRFLVVEGPALADPAGALRPPPVPQGLPKALSEEEVGSLLGAVTGDWPRAAPGPSRPGGPLRHRGADFGANGPLGRGRHLGRTTRPGPRQRQQGAPGAARTLRPPGAGRLVGRAEDRSWRTGKEPGGPMRRPSFST